MARMEDIRIIHRISDVRREISLQTERLYISHGELPFMELVNWYAPYHRDIRRDM
jgi:hypothetical protein